MTRGEYIAQAVRDFLTTNGLKQSQLTGAMLAEQADRMLAHLEKLEKKKKRLATEDEWLRDMQDDPAMVGVDVRKALAEAQFWAKNNSRVCTRRFFCQWLLNPRNRPILNGGGQAPRQQKAPAVETSFPGWLAILNTLYPNSVMAKGGLFEIQVECDYEFARLEPSVRKAICEEAGKR